MQPIKIVQTVQRSFTAHAGITPSDPDGEDFMAAGASALMSSLPESAAWKAAISAAAISVADLSFAEPAGPNSDVAGLPGLPVLLAGLDSGPADTAARPSGDGAPRSSARWLLLPLLGAPLLRRSAWVRRSLSCWGAALAAPPRPSGAVPGLLSRGPEGTASAAAGPVVHHNISVFCRSHSHNRNNSFSYCNAFRQRQHLQQRPMVLFTGPYAHQAVSVFSQKHDGKRKLQVCKWLHELQAAWPRPRYCFVALALNSCMNFS